ncbi:Protein N-acetyltransferase, RimJ/RimL family [Janthinobacterium sp. OK676]|uniref:GNAT family N-acetyltransferase n=1 Tax=unclassified Janthinobacterium TaxID=2610881 RepID=UPI00088E23B8|nr:MULTISPECIES: GNAT family N-acetyltransferase [unclassified Janthinobacterium]PJJ19439.1 RimJ/RimL family protein N-acetyltransferase [Janthinobacterium sp. 67]SDM73716.1 Protein N-acetyltransferase, RimJ/RimL family [Janthinobacterium sp. OK676]
MPAITVRPLAPDDASAYRALRLAGIAELPAAFCTTHAAESGLPLARLAERLRATSHQIIFGAFDQEQLIAIAGLRREPIAVVHDKASLWGVYVAPQARGLGAGRQLVQAAIAHACSVPELGRVRLAVAQDNHAALNLYLGCGFSLADSPASDGMLQMQLLLPRPARASAESNVFMKINTLQIPAK